MSKFSRCERIFGDEYLNKLKDKHIAVFGLGGVGGHVVESLVRTGIKKITICDGDIIDISNINRQIIATEDNIGEKKVIAMEKRILTISSDVEIIKIDDFFNKDSVLDFKQFDYVVDAIDMVSAKIEIIKRAKEANAEVISSMGTGNKMDPTMLEVADISKTKVCPLAKVMRKELRNLEIKNVKVVYSQEEPVVRANPPGSNAFVPAAGGLILSSVVIRDLLRR